MINEYVSINLRKILEKGLRKFRQIHNLYLDIVRFNYN